MIQIVLSLEVTNWITGCIRTTNYVVLVNEEPTNFSRCLRGLRQGCPLSPLLLLLIIEGLIRMILRVKANNKIEGVSISLVLKVTHLLFLDDVSIFGRDTLEEWQV